MDRVLLFSYKSADVRVSVEAFFDDAGSFIVEGYDIGKAVEQFWGDSDYEYSTTVKSSELKNLYAAASVPEGAREELLTFIQKNYSGNNCFSEFRNFLSDNNIVFESFSWN